LEEVVVRVGHKSIMLIVGYPQGILDQQQGDQIGQFFTN